MLIKNKMMYNTEPLAEKIKLNLQKIDAIIDTQAILLYKIREIFKFLPCLM